MFTDINEYITRPITERKQHLLLDENCIEIGGKDSRHYRGLLAHYLKTTIPSGMKIHLCHACYNHKCSNPNHLYWGTASENQQDSINHDISRYHNLRRPVTLEYYGPLIEKYSKERGWKTRLAKELGIARNSLSYILRKVEKLRVPA